METAPENQPDTAPAEAQAAAVDAAPEASVTPKEDDFLNMLAAYEGPASDRPKTKFLINDRYRIDYSRRMPEYDRAQARAYACTDTEGPDIPLYALLCPFGLPYRMNVIEALLATSVPHLQNPVAAGVVALPESPECRMAVVCPRPSGMTLEALLQQQGKALPDGFIRRQVIAPLTETLQMMAQLKIVHGGIRPDNIWLDEQKDYALTLGECVSEPCGMAQPYLYETLERTICAPEGKGQGDPTTDMYALGVLTLTLLCGGHPLAAVSKAQYFYEIYNRGSYNLLLGKREFAGSITDLLRGTLSDISRERWTVAQLEQWLEGKQFNMIRPSMPIEAPRPYVFGDKDYFNRKSLAYGLFRDWEHGNELLAESPKLIRWVEMSVVNPVVADKLRGIARGAKAIGSDLTSKDNDDLQAKLITVLDPPGPLRYRKVSVMVDGLGALLALAFSEKQQDVLDSINRLFRCGLVEVWGDLQSGPQTPEVSHMLWVTQKVHNFLRVPSLGFGMERCLYELNPHLPCQSQLVRNDHVMTLEQLLYALDRQAKEKASRLDPVDRHVAAFICTRLEMIKQIQMHELDKFPKFAGVPQLKMLRLLVLAQQKVGAPPLKGLTWWMCERLKPTIELLQSRSARQFINRELQKHAKSGQLEKIMQLLINAEMLGDDQRGFYRAALTFSRNKERLKHYRDRDKMLKRADYVGRKASVATSYMVALLTVAVVIGHSL